VEVHACNSSIWEAEAEGVKFEVSLRYIMRPYLSQKTNQPTNGSQWLTPVIPATQEAEIRIVV
jgi:hypothetical protein